MLTETAAASLAQVLEERPLAGDEMREIEGMGGLCVSLVDPSAGIPGYRHTFIQTIGGYTRHFYEKMT